MESVLQLREVWKTFRQSSGQQLHALRAVSLDVLEGRAVSVVGRSGSGKSTLLHVAAGIEEPTRGRVSVLGRDLAELGERERSRMRRDAIGLVFQFFHLLSHLSVLENVLLPGMIAGDAHAAISHRARELLRRVGLGDRAGDSVDKLSGGEMQRVAICRAVLRRPRLLLADEPTGSLDDENGRLVMQLLLELARAEGATLVYVTHSVELAALADERLTMHSGLLEPERA